MKRSTLIMVGLLVLLTLIALSLPIVASAQTDSPLPPPDAPPGPPPPSGSETLKLVLLWLIGGSGAGAVAYWLLEHVSWLGNLPSDQKRYAALILSAGLACLAFAAAVGLSYQPDPGSGQAWLEQLFAIAYLAVTAGQALHGWRKLGV